MSRRMIFVFGISALAGLCIALMLGDRRVPRPAAKSSTHLETSGDHPADDMAAAIRKAIEGDKSP